MFTSRCPPMQVSESSIPLALRLRPCKTATPLCKNTDRRRKKPHSNISPRPDKRMATHGQLRSPPVPPIARAWSDALSEMPPAAPSSRLSAHPHRIRALLPLRPRPRRPQPHGRALSNAPRLSPTRRNSQHASRPQQLCTPLVGARHATWRPRSWSP